MMIEQHYDDEKIIGFLQSDHVDTVVHRDPHLKGCALCADSLAGYRVIADTLGVEAVWDLRDLREDEPPVLSTVSTLRDFAASIASEDADAARYVPQLLEGPREWWSTRLRRSSQFRTAGVVRRLIEANDRAIDTMPPDAVEITALAVEIAESLDVDRYPSDTVLKLRGAAWRERAFALVYVGRFKEAMAAVTAGEDAFRGCMVAEYEQARLAVVKASVLRGLNRLTEAEAVADLAAVSFGDFGDAGRVASTRSLKATILWQANDFRSALDRWLELESEYAGNAASDAHARLLANIGLAYQRLGEAENAARYFSAAGAMFEFMETPTEAARVRWNAAILLNGSGRQAEAARLLRAVKQQFETLAMRHDAILVGLDLAEISLAGERWAEAETLCRSAVGDLERLGLLYTPRALSALAFMREAVANRTATPALARHVRSYIAELPRQPQLQFAPPPQ